MVNDAPGSIFGPGLVFQARYRLDEIVAAGGMAQVWRGQDLVLQRTVAIKLLHPHLARDEIVMERFRREAVAAARLTHPNIVPTFDTGADHGAAYIVLGFVDGPTLAQILVHSRFDARTACLIGARIADALDYAHRQGLVHRDIKPANVMVMDNNERVMVADFGIARVITESLDPGLTLPGFVMGTPDYLAPELLTDQAPTAAVDLFALGILLHEMFCGHTVADVTTRLVPKESSATPTICTALPSPLATIVDRATRYESTDRYASAAEMRDALEEGAKQFPQPESDPAIGIGSGPPDGAGQPTQAIPTVPPRSSTPSRPKASSNRTAQDAARARTAARRLRTTTLVVIAMLIIVFAAIGRMLGSLSSNDQPKTTASPVAVSVSNATSFDPLGSDKVENETAIKNALDGDPGTSWTSETYSSRKFGNLKSGTGIQLTLSGSTRLSNLEVTSPSSGWAASVYVSNQGGSGLDAWGSPVTGLDAIPSGTTTFRLSGTQGSHILLWFTDLGTANKVQIEDIVVDGR